MRLVFAVTNDLTYDQRMQRICTSLAASGFDVLLIGRGVKTSVALTQKIFRQKRIRCIFNKGFLFYAEYNFRLFFLLLFIKMNLVCAIDLDTITACYFASAIRNKKRVYDAHELFTEQKEIVTRPFIHKVWLAIEKCMVPKFRHGYTVNGFIATELQRRYNVNYSIVKNLPVSNYALTAYAAPKFIIYQGAVNQGRSFETLIPAMKQVNAKLIICGNGNFFAAVQQLVSKDHLRDKVELRGYVLPELLRQITPTAYMAVTLFEPTGLNQYNSLSNRFFDYIMAGVPQVCVNYPEYKIVNDRYNVALMIDDVQTDTIAAALNKLLADEALHELLHKNCVIARRVLNWEQEEKKLVAWYHQLTLK